MRLLYTVLLLCHITSAVKHSLKYFLTATSGVRNVPEFVGAAMVDDVQIGYCDSEMQTAEPKQDWMKKLILRDSEHLQWYVLKCSGNQQVFRANINILKERLNQTAGVHILQRMNGCEWDDETGDITGFNQYGYDGEDFIALDLKTLTWTAPRLQAVSTKLRWDAEKARLEHNKNYYIHKCPEWLKKYVQYGKQYLQSTVPSSVSLLQTSPSSPVSCHATGFYPGRADMFWRKDGEELHEDVEILPNHDGSFQMRVDLNISSVRPEDWSSYDCVFHLSGAKDRIITKLDKAEIRTNRVPPPEFPAPAAAAVAVGLMLLLVGITGLFIWRKRNGGIRSTVFWGSGVDSTATDTDSGLLDADSVHSGLTCGLQGQHTEIL